jgi:hypothetical protein
MRLVHDTLPHRVCFGCGEVADQQRRDRRAAETYRALEIDFELIG